MTDLQEVILDSLMGAERIGVLWQPGPLRLAFDILRANGLTKRKDPGRALGFPLPLCSAIEGSCDTLKTLEEVRSLSIALFSELEPRSTMPRLEERDLVEVAYWTLHHAQQLHNQREPLCDRTAAELERYLETGKVVAGKMHELSAELERAIHQRSRPQLEFDSINLALTTFFFALHTARQASEGKWPEENVAMTTLYTGRLAALLGGFQGGVHFCIDLARQMGL